VSLSFQRLEEIFIWTLLIATVKEFVHGAAVHPVSFNFQRTMNQVEPSQPTAEAPAENLSNVFFWIVAGAVLYGGLPYLFPTGST